MCGCTKGIYIMFECIVLIYSNMNQRNLTIPTVLLWISDQILENLPFGHKQYFEKTQLKIYTMFCKLNFFAHLDKATIKPTCCEVSHQKLLFPRRYGWLHQSHQCARKVGFPISGHILLLYYRRFIKSTNQI